MMRKNLYILFNKYRLTVSAFFLFLKKIKKMKKIKKEKIVVVFISQMSNLWTNVSRIYDLMIDDQNFDVYILSVPEYRNENHFEAYNFHKQSNHKNNLNCFFDGKYLDLKLLQPDYVFYDRPYSSYLPKQYRNNIVSRYAKTCYVPYGCEMMPSIYDTSLKVNFFKDLYLFFADINDSYEYIKKQEKISLALKLRRNELVGHPTFTDVMMSEKKSNVFWSDKSTKLKAIWAPRWTDDIRLGGSNFLKYKDKIISLFLENENMSLVFRPHPLTFSNYLEKKLITKKDLDEYLNIFNNSDDLFYDNRSEYFSTFWHSDVLIADISSIIPYYFLTGKPIILCDTGYIFDGEIMESISACSYIAHSFEDIENVIKDLHNNIDPLKEKRLKIRDELFYFDNILNIPSRIVNIIKSDYKKEK